ncbi:MAG: hypothetical protein CM15mP100_2600 [Alphaproteobacteria bacterium]|nr:MAG: hypothetical protein CM15mP100_2600 [Alphaproteobacteria bacterium]
MKDRSPANFSELGDPIELVARFVVQQDWYLKQTHADGLVVDVPGQWGQYQLRVDWQQDLQVLCVHVMLDLLFDDVPAVRLETLLSELNGHLFLGHFRLSSDKRQVQLYYVLPLRGAGGATPEQIEDVVIFCWASVNRLPLVLLSLSLPPDRQASSAGLIMVPVAGQA